MAKLKTTTIKRGQLITLESGTLGPKEFNMEAATNILSNPKNTGWKLPATSKYQFQDGKIIPSADSGATTKAKA